MAKEVTAMLTTIKIKDGCISEVINEVESREAWNLVDYEESVETDHHLGWYVAEEFVDNYDYC